MNFEEKQKEKELKLKREKEEKRKLDIENLKKNLGIDVELEKKLNKPAPVEINLEEFGIKKKEKIILKEDKRYLNKDVERINILLKEKKEKIKDLLVDREIELLKDKGIDKRKVKKHEEEIYSKNLDQIIVKNITKQQNMDVLMYEPHNVKYPREPTPKEDNLDKIVMDLNMDKKSINNARFAFESLKKPDIIENLVGSNYSLKRNKSLQHLSKGKLVEAAFIINYLNELDGGNPELSFNQRNLNTKSISFLPDIDKAQNFNIVNDIIDKLKVFKKIVKPALKNKSKGTSNGFGYSVEGQGEEYGGGQYGQGYGQYEGGQYGQRYRQYEGRQYGQVNGNNKGVEQGQAYNQDSYNQYNQNYQYNQYNQNYQYNPNMNSSISYSTNYAYVNNQDQSLKLPFL